MLQPSKDIRASVSLTITYAEPFRTFYFHALRKKYFQAPFLVLQLVTNRGLNSVPGGPNSTWKDHDRNIGVQVDKDILIIVLPGTIWSFQVLTGILYIF